MFLVNWKIEGEGKPVVRMINPTPTEIEELMRFRLVGFNCRRYDNHILYARLMGYTNEQLYNLSQKLSVEAQTVSLEKLTMFLIRMCMTLHLPEIKRFLKKLEIEMGIHHQSWASLGSTGSRRNVDKSC